MEDKSWRFIAMKWVVRDGRRISSIFMTAGYTCKAGVYFYFSVFKYHLLAL